MAASPSQTSNQVTTATKGVLGRLVDETGAPKQPSHCIIQYGGRVRLPDKLMEILNNDFCPEVMWWQPDGECFAFNANTVQKKVLDVWFRGTKLSSFIRSLNRWGFRRVFYHALPEFALAFHHPLFAKTSTEEQLKSMKMSKSSKSNSAMAVAANASASTSGHSAGTTSTQPSAGTTSAQPSAVFPNSKSFQPSSNLFNGSSMIAATPAPAAPTPIMSTLPSFQQVISGSSHFSGNGSGNFGTTATTNSCSAFERVLGSGTNSNSNSTSSQQQQMLLKLITEQREQQREREREQQQRNCDLLALSSKVQPLSYGSSSNATTSSLHTALSSGATHQRELLLLARAKQELQQQQQQQEKEASALRRAFLTLQQRQHSNGNHTSTNQFHSLL